jgi:hypothetical protein
MGWANHRRACVAYQAGLAAFIGTAPTPQQQFDEAVSAARHANVCRTYARAIKHGTTIYGWSLQRAQREQRASERAVRRIADTIIAQAVAA